MAYVDFKDLLTRIASDKALPDKVFLIFAVAGNPKYDRISRLKSVVYKFFN